MTEFGKEVESDLFEKNLYGNFGVEHYMRIADTTEIA